MILKYRRQRDGFGCGPVALHNAFVSKGIKVPLKLLYIACGTTKRGTRLSRLLDVVKASGFKVSVATKIKKKGEYLMYFSLTTRSGRKISHIFYIKDNYAYNYFDASGPLKAEIVGNTDKIIRKSKTVTRLIWKIK